MSGAETSAPALAPGKSPLSDDARQKLAERIVHALATLFRHARSYGQENPVFTPWMSQLQEAMRQLLDADGSFALQLAKEGLFINGVHARFDASNQEVAASLERELRQRGLEGLSAASEPPQQELRALIRLVTRRSAPRSSSAGGLQALRLLHARPLEERAPDATEKLDKLLDAYARAASFIERTLAQLRAVGATIPFAAVSRIAQELVEQQAEHPLRFLQLARVKPAQAYWGQHAVNVAVLAVSFGARLGMERARRHDLAMAALLHDVGVAALPPELLTKCEPLSERELLQLKSSPLLAARTILRGTEVHTAALECAMATYECHLDLVPPSTEALHDIGLPGRILALCEAFDALTTERPFRPARLPRVALRVMQTELVFRFDPQLLELFPRVLEPLLG